MKLDEILQQAGKHKARKRLGRGRGSGQGKTGGRGHGGNGQRAGGGRLFGFEGGQNPAFARLPKRGFNNIEFADVIQIVNLDTLEAMFDSGARVDSAAMAAAGAIDNPKVPVKVLGNGSLSKKLTVVAAKFSQSAMKKIQDAGGAAEQV